jgi:hypothetical protein
MKTWTLVSVSTAFTTARAEMQLDTLIIADDETRGGGVRTRKPG